MIVLPFSTSCGKRVGIFFLFFGTTKVGGKRANLADAWEQIKGRLAIKLGEGAYQNWISATALASFENGELTVNVPNPTTEAWIQQEYTPQILDAIRELNLPVISSSTAVSLWLSPPPRHQAAVLPFCHPPSSLPVARFAV